MVVSLVILMYNVFSEEVCSLVVSRLRGEGAVIGDTMYQEPIRFTHIRKSVRWLSSELPTSIALLTNNHDTDFLGYPLSKH